MRREIIFLDRKTIELLHAESLRQFSGRDGLRDSGLADSAIGAVISTYLYKHCDLFDLAAAYAFHISQAQAFTDGNKRTAAGAMLIFLNINGIRMRTDDGRIYSAMLGIANRQISKDDLAFTLRSFFKH